jgi:hypothetical protein
MEEEYISVGSYSLFLGCPERSDLACDPTCTPSYLICMECTSDGSGASGAKTRRFEAAAKTLVNYDIFNGVYVGVRKHRLPVVGETIPVYFLGTTTQSGTGGAYPTGATIIDSDTNNPSNCQIWQTDWYYFFNWCGEVYFIGRLAGTAAPEVSVVASSLYPYVTLQVSPISQQYAALPLYVMTRGNWTPNNIIPIWNNPSEISPGSAYSKHCVPYGYTHLGPWVHVYEDWQIDSMESTVCDMPLNPDPIDCVYSTGLKVANPITGPSIWGYAAHKVRRKVEVV